MSEDLNQCSFIGRLGQDPEGSTTPGGVEYSKFSLACGWKTKEAEGVEWVSVACFGKLAGVMNQYLKKGSRVYIQGRFKTTSYDKSGVKTWSTSIIADRMQMLDSRPSEASTTTAQQQAPQQQASTPDDFDDDIPFS